MAGRAVEARGSGGREAGGVGAERALGQQEGRLAAVEGWEGSAATEVAEGMAKEAATAADPQSCSEWNRQLR